MSTILSSFSNIAMIFIVILFFNLMIFVHELGHFWAGRWRGAYIDRFQIWFGKPIWKKTINGVEWGLGWIPAGGFVSLPQLGDMEAIEGSVDPEVAKTLKPLKPLDKIIIAAAGPIFSFLLACFFALIVWMVGTKDLTLPSTIGYVVPNSPAAAAGLQAGDKITAIDGQEVDRWAGNMEGVSELIAMSEHEQITFDIVRGGQALTLTSQFELPETDWWQRTGMRSVGIAPATGTTIGSITAGSPAAKAGLMEGGIIETVNGQRVYSPLAVHDMTKAGEALEMGIKLPDGAEGIHLTTITPEIPSNWVGKEGARPLLGFSWASSNSYITTIHPTPWKQICNSFKWMGDTIAKVSSPTSSVGMQHMSGPVGIGNALFNMLSSEGGWQMVLWFAVIINVNLAVLNMLPLPVVDGGHVVLGIIESIVGRPVGGNILGWIQIAFIAFLLSFFIYVTTKDIGDLIGGSEEKTEQLPPPIFE